MSTPEVFDHNRGELDIRRVALTWLILVGLPIIIGLLSYCGISDMAAAKLGGSSSDQAELISMLKSG